MAYKNSIESISNALRQYREEVGNDITDVLEEAADQAAAELRQQTNGGKWKKYPRTWKWDEQGSRGGPKVVVHNAKNYQLTHLLEFGHALRRGGRTVGSTAAYPHIETVNAKTEEMIVEKIEQKLGG